MFSYTLDSSLSSYGIAHLVRAAKSQVASAADSSAFIRHPCVARPYSRKACCSHLRCCQASQQDLSLSCYYHRHISEHQYYFESINISSSVSSSSSWRNLTDRLRYCQTSVPQSCAYAYRPTLKNDRMVTGMNRIRSRNEYNLRFGAFPCCKSPQEKVRSCECMFPSGSTSILQGWSLGTAVWLRKPETATTRVLVDHRS